MRMFDAAMLFCFYFPATCTGNFFQIGDVYIHGKYFTGQSRNYMINYTVPGKELKYQLDLKLDTVIGDYLYFNNRVHSQTDNTQFRVIGWDFQVGVTLISQIDIEYGHFSNHWIDFHNPTNPYPLEDYVGFKFYFNRHSKPLNKPLIEGWD